MLIYIYRKEIWENSCYFNKKLPNKDNNSNKKIENNKVDKKNKENILNNKLFRALVNNKVIQILSIQKEKKHSWTSDTNKY